MFTKIISAFDTPLIIPQQRMAVFSVRDDEQILLQEFNRAGHLLTFSAKVLDQEGARTVAPGTQVVSVFVNDVLDTATLQILHDRGVRLIALRCAGYNNVDLAAAAQLGMQVVRVPAYSPRAIAEHAMALLLALTVQLESIQHHMDHNDYSLGLHVLGKTIGGSTVGIIGTGKIGQKFARMIVGFDAQVKAYDPYQSPEILKMGIPYTSIDEIIRTSDIISIHMPATPDTYHLLNEARINQLKPGAIIINTSRGDIVDTAAVIAALQSGTLGGYGADVYEKERGLFFYDHTRDYQPDPLFEHLRAQPHVVLTPHSAFYKEEAVRSIAQITMQNIDGFAVAQIPPEVIVRPK